MHKRHVASKIDMQEPRREHKRLPRSSVGRTGERWNMPLFLCRWPNGDFSIVKAGNKEQAIETLDEIGNAEGCPVTALRDFMVHFALTDVGDFELEDYGEMTRERIMRLAYPVLERALVKDAPTDKNGDFTEEGYAVIRNAVSKERERVVAKKAKEPRTLRGRGIKSVTDAPTSKVNRIVGRVAEKVLENFKGKGKTN